MTPMSTDSDIVDFNGYVWRYCDARKKVFIPLDPCEYTAEEVAGNGYLVDSFDEALEFVRSNYGLSSAQKAVRGLRDASRGRDEAWKRYNHSCAYYTETVIHD